MTTPLVHVLIVALALVAYVVLTITGHDGNPVFVFVGGQFAGAAAERVGSKS